MKGFRLFFTVSLAMLTLCGVHADDAATDARAAARRGATGVSSAPTNSTTNSRLRSSAANTGASNPTAQSTTISRSTAATAPASVRERTTGARDTSTTGVSTRTPGATVQSRTTATPAVTSRGGAGTATRPATTGTQRVTQSRTATTSAATRATSQTRAATTSRVGTAASNAALSRVSRAATGARLVRAGELTREEILTRNYSTCRDVYYECMDEFCANKDSQLKRCACSSRVNEFDKVKKQLAKAEDKMLDFSQRLLTVNMEKEDAAALNVATEGELAFQQKDTSASKKLLDEIAKKLNTSFDSNTFDNGANALSWSLNIDAAFDSVDSLMGASTTAKTGTALYSAALPICQEMALEVCSEEELAIATSGYLVAIEQDCNTVYKAYETQVDQAREKIREGGALLDISRLDIYQKRNSDDILTCKKKMLEKLYDTTVCGDNLGKCLDTTGRYIDPSTGAAFLTINLVNLGNLITRPTGEESWTTAPGNQAFVSYLNSKKKFLEPAMENCQDISDVVWDAFMEDALAQIKLAQESKMEEMRQSCTTLTTQCLTNTSDSIIDFDSRALSIFGVAADKTANAMCSEIKLACTALLETSGGGTDWVGGMTEIANDTTYDTILRTCREVGRACIIQTCRSIKGNFGLCEAMDTSNNRKAIINRTSCWNEVVDCVRSAGLPQVDDIMVRLGEIGELTDEMFYEQMYGAGYRFTNSTPVATLSLDAGTSDPACYVEPESKKLNCIYDLCQNECGCTPSGNSYVCSKSDSSNCHVCRIAEKIWGNCEASPNVPLYGDRHNRIKAPKDTETSTLLYWMAVNTGTDEYSDSCRNTLCGTGFYPEGNTCKSYTGLSNDCEQCDEDKRILVGNQETNCCADGTSKNNVCCTGVFKDNGNICVSSNSDTISSTYLRFNDSNYASGEHDYYLACIGGTVTQTGNTYKCSGHYILVTNAGYYNPKYIGGNYGNTVKSQVKIGNIFNCNAIGPTTYEFTPTADGWKWQSSTGETRPDVTGWRVIY